MISRREARKRIATVAVMLAAFSSGDFLETTRAAAASQGKAQAKKPNACLLVDREDMERLAKGKVTLLHNLEAANQTNCEVYLEGKPPREVIVLQVYWSGGRELAHTAKAEMAKRPASAKAPDLSSLKTGGAEDAYYGDAVAWVLKGDVFLRLTMPGLGPDDMQQNFVALLGKALSRLP